MRIAAVGITPDLRRSSRLSLTDNHPDSLGGDLSNDGCQFDANAHLLKIHHAATGRFRSAGGSMHAMWLRYFLLVGALTCIWSLATPLDASPDEPAHIERAVSIDRGEWLGASIAGVGNGARTRVRFPRRTSGPVFGSGDLRASHVWNSPLGAIGLEVLFFVASFSMIFVTRSVPTAPETQPAEECLTSHNQHRN
jgi:hypothetical protein